MKNFKKLSDEKKCIILFALAVIFGAIVFFTYSGGNVNQHEGVIRLHVIANSDSARDQGIKLKVRDAVLEHMQSRKDITCRDDMEEYIRKNSRRLEKIAEGVVASNGCDDDVKASLGVRYIPEKTYGDMTFPAGNYEALDLTIGNGEGENWWCVLFPPLCLLEEGTGTDEDMSEEDRVLAKEQKLKLEWKTKELMQ